MGRLLKAARTLPTPMRNVYVDIFVRWMVRIYKARLYSNPWSPDFHYPAFLRSFFSRYCPFVAGKEHLLPSSKSWPLPVGILILDTVVSSAPNTQNKVTMDPEKNLDIMHSDQPIDSSAAADAHLANQEDHEQTRMQAIKQNPWAFAWCMFAVWLTLLVSFENQASGIVIGIPQFRKDFGHLADGNYVLSAQWQAAFSGGPVAS
jgi:hypothetical protein